MEIREFQKMMEEIYGQRDRKRGVERTFLWIIEELGELVRGVRKKSREEIETEFADVVAWVFSLANLLDVDIEKVIGKYDGRCPKCKESPCVCEDGWK
jgi:NTP pyrophosphatase (non-canonical NTP hydrolase)